MAAGGVLRPSNIDASAGTIGELARIVPRLRAAWPGVRIVIRADSGFCRDSILRWCEEHGVDYVIGLSKNKRLVRALGHELHQAQQQFQATGRPARLFKELTWRTHQS